MTTKRNLLCRRRRRLVRTSPDAGKSFCMLPGKSAFLQNCVINKSTGSGMTIFKILFMHFGKKYQRK